MAEPTVRDLARACRDAVGTDAYEEILGMDDLQEALGFAWSALIEAGVEDPEAYLIEKGILEPGTGNVS